MEDHFNLLFFSFFFIFSTLLPCVCPLNQTSSSSSSSSSSTANPPQSVAPFKPSIAIIVALLTTIFSITFLLLLYTKHCKTRSNNNNNFHINEAAAFSSPAIRTNSGVRRTVIESLPVFKFGSLTGQKEGLECAVCLTRFDTTHVLRLLPKCKHAFHVECVDTWLDAHSTCPLCRHTVHPEDILLLQHQHQHQPTDDDLIIEIITDPSSHRRVSGRHSSAGERGGASNSSYLQHKPATQTRRTTTENNSNSNSNSVAAMALALRRSLDSSKSKRKNNHESSSSSSSAHHRKDGLLLDQNRKSHDKRRLEHRIILSKEERWSDVAGSDLLYLRSEMILSDTSRRYSSSSTATKRQDDGPSVINTRSVSEITGLSRFNNNYSYSYSYSYYGVQQKKKEKLLQRHKGVVSRWMKAWISQSQPNTTAT